jgi:CRP-like cAMP-binding protein
MNTPGTTIVAVAPLLTGLSEAERRAIMASAAPGEFPTRTVLCRHGEPAEAMFLIGSGRVRLQRTTADGRQILFRFIGSGECFGIGSLVPGPVDYMATAVAMDNIRGYRWEAGLIQSAAAAYPRLTQNALRIALGYLEEYGERHAALVSCRSEQRLARTLIHLATTRGRVLPTGVEVDVSNSDLASLSDLGLFTVSRQLKTWERDGHLVKRRQRVLIRHPEALHAKLATRR